MAYPSQKRGVAASDLVSAFDEEEERAWAARTGCALMTVAPVYKVRRADATSPYGKGWTLAPLLLVFSFFFRATRSVFARGGF